MNATGKLFVSINVNKKVNKAYLELRDFVNSKFFFWCINMKKILSLLLLGALTLVSASTSRGTCKFDNIFTLSFCRFEVKSVFQWQ